MHIILHLKLKHDWTVMKPFAKAVASAVAKFNSQRFTITSTRSKRTGRIFIDWIRNSRGATCIAPWGLRARPGATVSVPINREQLPDIAKAGFKIHEPPGIPKEWETIRVQTIPISSLRDLRVA